MASHPVVAKSLVSCALLVVGIPVVAAATATLVISGFSPELDRARTAIASSGPRPTARHGQGEAGVEGEWSARLIKMTMPPSARGRKRRLIRDGEVPHDLLVVIRATPADREAAVDEMVEDAELSSRQYVVEATPGTREFLYGVSVFARRPGVDVAAVTDRFPGAPAYIEVTIGALRAAGFVVLPTGVNVDHFEIQLVGGVHERDAAPTAGDLREAAARVLAAGSPLRPNPAYAGGTAEPGQEDR